MAGVPAVNPPDFGPTQAVANALNDLACNFTAASSKDSACTQDQFGSAPLSRRGHASAILPAGVADAGVCAGRHRVDRAPARSRRQPRSGAAAHPPPRSGSGATDIHPGTNLDPVHPAADTHAEPHINPEPVANPDPQPHMVADVDDPRSAPHSRDPNPVVHEKRFRHADDASTDCNRPPVALTNAQRHHPRAGWTCGLILRLDPV